MRLTLTLPELDSGLSVQGGTKSRITELQHLAARREPVAITPVTNHDQKVIAVVLLTEEVVDYTGKGTSITIKFRPVWCRTFTLCSITKDTITALMCEFDFGKYWIDRYGVKSADMTTSGDGCDPTTVRHSEIVLGDMLDDEKINNMKRNAIAFIQRSF
jgi:hypothetical protein